MCLPIKHFTDILLMEESRRAIYKFTCLPLNEDNIEVAVVPNIIKVPKLYNAYMC